MIKQIDALTARLAQQIICHRWWVIAATCVLVALAAVGGRQLEFSNNYRVFFGKENPELVAFEEFQATYTKNDNILIVIQPRGQKVFSPQVTEAVEALTAAAWNIPYTIRVDSISNFQHSWAQGDDLTVEDLLKDSGRITQAQLDRKEAVALAEPLLRGNLISDDAATTGINITLQYPEKSIKEVPAAVGAVRALVADFTQNHPDLKVALTGLSMMNNSFSESSMKDLQILVPLMFLVLVLMMIFTLKSISGTLATVLVIGFSSITAMGLAGYLGIQLTTVSAIAPTIILTLSIADSIHLLVSMRKQMQKGLTKFDAIRESIRINAIPVTVTSLTTVVGFMGLNFTDTPPFHDLGNITAMGIAAAWFYSITFLPAMMAVMPFKVRRTQGRAEKQRPALLTRFADFLIRYYKPVGLSVALLSTAAVVMLPRIELNDEWVKYFDRRIAFRNDAEFAMKNLTGLYKVEYSLPAAQAGDINTPEYLRHLEAFTGWLKSQNEVEHVYSYADIIKRLNKNMHADDPAWYRIPKDRELAAQYLLLYELSLPFGLDLNDRINVDKSATRITVSLAEISTKQVREFIAKSNTWLKLNAPAYMAAAPTGATVMFSYISERNIKSMIKGNLLALGLIALVIIISLRNLRLGLMSLIPNMLPILVTFGLWSVFVGRVGMAAATVASTSLGIIVDDTVHFLAKYLRAREELNLSPPQAVKYTFDTVGPAIIATTVILGIGFAILSTSTFLVNAQMGMLTALAIVVAFIFDFTLLPVMLLIGNSEKGVLYEPNCTFPESC